MKKIAYVGFLFLLLLVVASASYENIWKVQGDDIYFDSGNVGIGTDSPTQALHIEGNLNITGSVYANSSSLYLGEGKISFDSTSDRFVFYNESGGTEEVPLVSGEDEFPLGSVLAFSSQTCPYGWEVANGSNGTPDLRGIFVRGAGTSGVLSMANGSSYSAVYGSYENDSFQGHLFRTRMIVDSSPGSSTGGNYYPINADTSNSGWGDYSVAELISDSYGTPRTGNETVPASYALTYCIKLEDDFNFSSSVGKSGSSVYLLNTSKKLGVGTTNPGESLEVAGNISSNGGDICVTGGNCLSNIAIFPIGGIAMFNTSCPAGWNTCNGSNGTPDLRNKFIRSMTTAGNTGGSDDAIVVSHSHTFSGNALATHSHTFTPPRHTHTINFPSHKHSVSTYNDGGVETRVARGQGTTGSGTAYTGYANPSAYVDDADYSGPLTTTSTSGGTPSGTISTDGSSATNANMPEYYSLVFCQKAS